MRKKLLESLVAVLPLTVLVLVIDLVFVGSNGWDLGMFIFGAAALVLGLGLFTLGADVAMIPIGNNIGSHLSKRSKKLFMVLLIVFILGFIITAAEPDLHVLAKQATSDGSLNITLLLCVAIGVGIFFAISIIRTIFNIPLRYVLFASYGIMFVIAALMPQEYLAISLDSGGVTTGPITVPFLMAFGVGMAAARGSKESEDNSFGTIALCSIGPIIAMMILSLTGILTVEPSVSTPLEINSFIDILHHFGEGLRESAVNILIPLVPIALIFFIFQLTALKLPRQQVIKIVFGIVYTYLGLTLFLAGADTGFTMIGKTVGQALGARDDTYILIPMGILIGAFIVLAEPAVHVLNKQVEEVTGGAISRKTMLVCLTIGVAASVGLAMLRVITGLSIWYFIIPAYAISLALMFFVPPLFTGIAFDSGGVASGPLTTTFLMPLCIGICGSIGGNTLMDAFGSTAFVAMTPLIVIQLLGLLYKIRLNRNEKRVAAKASADDVNWQDSPEFETIDFDELDGGNRHNAEQKKKRKLPFPRIKPKKDKKE